MCAANSFSSTNFNAPVGQASTQAGSWPALVRSMQRSHLSITLPSVETSIAPNGQTIRQNLQPIHLSCSINTGPSASCRCIAAVGQIEIHGASSQCLHCSGTASSPAASTTTLLCGVGRSAIASSRTLDLECATAHAISQLLQAKHFSIFTIMALPIFVSKTNRQIT